LSVGLPDPWSCSVRVGRAVVGEAGSGADGDVEAAARVVSRAEARVGAALGAVVGSGPDVELAAAFVGGAGSAEPAPEVEVVTGGVGAVPRAPGRSAAGAVRGTISQATRATSRAVTTVASSPTRRPGRAYQGSTGTR
jgi:hypothetical protein